MHLLIKYFNNKKFADEFVSGSLYMNSLNYFWNNGFDEQRDMFEGIVCEVPVNKINVFPDPWPQMQASDYRFRADGYSFCNVLCFEKLRFTASNELVHADITDSMLKFGNSIVIIHNEDEFVKRVYKAVRSNGFKYMCGEVRYHPQKKNGKTANEGIQTIFKSVESQFDIDEVRNRFESVTNRDCFDKTDQYGNQREWRIARYRGIKDTRAYRLEIGDISDIVTVCNSKNFHYTMQDVISEHGLNNYEGYRSNIGLNDFRRLFCDLGDNKASLIMTMGK